VHWSLGSELFTAEIDSVFAAKDSSAAKADPAKADKEGSLGGADEPLDFKGAATAVRSLSWEAKADAPETDVWLVGATILPMDDLSVIRDGVVHVEGNRIAAVGTRAELTPPKGARVLDAAGATLLPGLVDVHAHTGGPDGGLHAQQNWAFLAQLAFGVTTTHDPSNDTQSIFAESERVKAGLLLGPRIFSTGTILYGADGDFKTVIDDLDDAIDAVHRTAAWGAFSVKSYNQPRREQRQMVIEAGRKLQVMVVPEGGSTLQNNITHLIDGHTTIEHSIPVAPLYDPEMRLLSRFGTGYTPTLVVGYGGIWGENYWYHHTNVWENERLVRFVPRSVVDPRSRRRVMAPEEEYHHFALAKTAADVVHRGGNVQLGAHGQLQGLAAHWELWMFEQGGMTAHEALRASTWMGARAIGLDGDLGSIRPGKLADLIVVEGDLLTNLRGSENVRWTMSNGRLYDARTLEQLEPERRPPPTWPDVDGVTVSATCACMGGAAHAH
jgi:imidazolonepropionase-like amidohydrolase